MPSGIQDFQRNALPDRTPPPIDFLYRPDYLKQPRPPTESELFKGRRNRKTYRFLRSASVCDNKACIERIKSSLDTLDRSIKRFKIYRDISAVIVHWGDSAEN